MYAEVFVNVDGAEEDHEIFHDEAWLKEFLVAIENEARDHGYPTEVYVRYHDHKVGECECAQYEQDHKPTYSYNG